MVDKAPAGEMAEASGATTQRTYTLRSRPAFSENSTAEEIAHSMRSMKEALWATHEAVNERAKAFGDWLLTHIVEHPATNSVTGGGGRG